MPTPTYIPLATQNLTSAASVTFSSIPATYRDIIIVVRGSITSAGDVWMRFNGDSGSNYTFVQMAGNGSSASSSSGSQTFGQISNTGSGEIAAIASVMDYSATDKHKTILSRNTGDIVRAWAVRWANTAAINQIQVSAASSFSTATISLYGIAG